LQNRELVTKSKNLCVEFGTVLKGRGEQSEASDENGVHGGSEHDLHKDHNLCVSNADRVFGNHADPHREITRSNEGHS
jgi:hypothetical protein